MREEPRSGVPDPNRRWNFAVNALDLTSVNLARAFIFSTTILSLYASYLTSRAVLIGLIPAIQQVGYLLPQLFTARKAESLRHQKPFVVRISVFERLPYLVVALAIFAFPGAPAWLAYAILALGIGVATGCAGLATPAWKTMIAKVIHPDRRGLLFGIGMSAGGFLGVAGAALSRWILGRVSYPFSYGWCFLFSFVAQAISWLFLTLNREPVDAEERPRVDMRVYLRKLPVILARNRSFRSYLISQSLIILGTMGMSFYIIYGRVRFGISDSFAASITMVALLSQSLGTAAIGWLSDRLGHKWMTQASTVLGLAALGVVLCLPSRGWLYLVFVLANLSVAGLGITRAGITMEFGSLRELPTYTALSGTLLAFPTLLAPVIGGWIIDGVGYTALFVSALSATVVGLVYASVGVVEARVKRDRGREDRD